MIKLLEGSKFRLVAWGGLFTAIVVIMAVIGTAMSFIDILLYLAVTPIIIAVMQGGLIFGLQVSLASAILISSILGFFPAGAYFVIATAPVGLVLGEMFRRKSSIVTVIIILSITISVCMVGTTYIASRAMGRTFNEDLRLSAKSSAQLLEDVVNEYPETKKLLQKPLPEQEVIVEILVKTFYMTIPAMLLVVGLAYAFYLWFFNAWLLNRLKLTDKSFSFDMQELFLYPPWFGYILAASLLVLPVSNATNNEALSGTAMNVFLIFSFLFFIKGLFMLRGLLFIFIRSFPMRLLAGLLLMTLGAPFVALMGFIFCITQRDIQIRYRT